MSRVNLSDFIQKSNTHDIVINTDIDGFLSGMILQEFYDCNVVGFTNSQDSIWLSPHVDSLFEPIYVDIYINDKSVFSIDQHVIASDKTHLSTIQSFETKLNPNLDIQEVTHKDNFTSKYPFGTVHYLIALMAYDNNELSYGLKELLTKKQIRGKDDKEYNINPIRLLLRADDALYSTLGPYKKNAETWWQLLMKSNSVTITNFYQIIKNHCSPDQNNIYKSEMTDFFINGLGCDGNDGSFSRITNDDNRTLQDRVLFYNSVISEIMGINLVLPDSFDLYKGDSNRTSMVHQSIDEAFTYAFIYGPNYKNGFFSYTKDFIKQT